MIIRRWKGVTCGFLIMLLCACGTSAMIVEERNLALEPFAVDFFGQYRIEHAFIHEPRGVSGGHACYPRAFSTGEFSAKFIYHNNGRVDYPALVESQFSEEHPVSVRWELIGSEDPTLFLPLKMRKRLAATGEVHFGPLCTVYLYGGNGINFGIRSSASQSIEEHLAWTRSMISGPNRRYRSNHFIEEPHTREIGNTTWTTYTASVQKRILEVWLTPIGDSGYYIYIGGALGKSRNDREYQAARRLFDGIIESVVIEPQNPDRDLEASTAEQPNQP